MHTSGTNTKHSPLAIENLCVVCTLYQYDVYTRYTQYSFLEGHCIYVKVKAQCIYLCVIYSVSMMYTPDMHSTPRGPFNSVGSTADQYDV